MTWDLKRNTKEFQSFLQKKDEAFIEIAKGVTPIMNKIHNLHYDYLFWMKVLHGHINWFINQEENLNNTGKPLLFRSITSSNTSSLFVALKQGFKYYIKSILNRAKKSELLSTLRSYEQIAVGNRASELHRIRGYIPLKKYLPFFFIPSFHARKKWLKEIDSNKNFKYRSFLKSLPLCYVEYFHYLLPNIDFASLNVKEIHGEQEHLGSLFIKVLIARAFSEGVEVHDYQGGCFWGETNNHPRTFQYKLCSSYHTYGWKINPKDIPDRAYRIEKFVEDYKKVKANSSGETFDLALILSIANSGLKNHYKYFVEMLAETINRQKYNRILLRPRPSGPTRSMIQEANYINTSTIEIDNGGRTLSETTALSKCNIIVYTPATNIYECAASYHPFLCYDMFLPASDMFSKHLDFFREVGVIHSSVESMVRFLNEIKLEDWWQAVYTDRRYELFLKEYCGKQ